MEVIYIDSKNIKELKNKQHFSAMALGYFDGVHLGHQKVIKEAQIVARKENIHLSVLSFFPHPKSILSNNQVVHYLEPLEERIKKIENLGVDYYYIVKFDKEFSTIAAETFIDEYVIGLGAKHIVCGFDYKYGHLAKGNRNTLKEYSSRGIGLSIVKEEKSCGEKISSTIIRQCMKLGKVSEIPSFLGTYYHTKYCFVNGVLRNYMIPASGIYKTSVETENQRFEANIKVDLDEKLYFENDWFDKTKLLKIIWLEKIS